MSQNLPFGPHHCQAHLADGRRCTRAATCVEGRTNTTRVVCRQHKTAHVTRYDAGPINLWLLDADLLRSFIAIEDARREQRAQQIAALRQQQIEAAEDLALARQHLAACEKENIL